MKEKIKRLFQLLNPFTVFKDDLVKINILRGLYLLIWLSIVCLIIGITVFLTQYTKDINSEKKLIDIEVGQCDQMLGVVDACYRTFSLYNDYIENIRTKYKDVIDKEDLDTDLLSKATEAKEDLIFIRRSILKQKNQVLLNKKQLEEK